MLTIITGANGAGKTAYAVAQLAELVKAQPERPIVVMGIPELQIPHEVAPPLSEWTRLVPTAEDSNIVEAEFTFPEGALVIIDEAQKVFRPRAVSSKVPDHVSAFEKHRHRGLDFWLITQHPGLLDSAIRKLQPKHVHLRSHWAGRELLEWGEGAHDPDSRADRAVAVRRTYKLPKQVFGQYKSASLHTKQKRRIPFALYVFIAVFLVAAALGWRMLNRVSTAISGESTYSGAVASKTDAPRAATAPAAAVASMLSVEAFVPRLNGRPESAPLYDGIRQVRAMPVVAGCVTRGQSCRCYTAQATDAGLDDGACRAWLLNPPFNPWAEPTRADNGQSKPNAAREDP